MKSIFFIISAAILAIYFYFPICTNKYEGRPKCEVLEGGTTTGPDSVYILATTLYEGGPVKNLLQGKGYRQAWQTPIKVRSVDFSQLYGGLEPFDEGGGKQTQSLDLKDSLGNVYSLRSVNKDPGELVPEAAFALRVDNIITDGMSAQHPYGALVLPPMQDAVGLWHTNPQLVYVPSQPALKDYNEKFKDRVYLLEYESEGSGQWTKLDHIEKIVDTDDLLEWIEKDASLSIDTASLVRARLFDLLVGDWDRHEGQWGWLVVSEGGKKTGIPMSCDRDNVFYGIAGLIPSTINRPFIKPILRPFTKEIDYLPGMMREFDSYFLYGVDEKTFVEQASYLQGHLTDEIIEKALRTWPKEFYELDGQDIKDKIIHRRNHLSKYAKEFHDILQERGALSELYEEQT